MFPYEKRYPWMPATISRQLEKKLAPFSPHAHGWIIYYRGASRQVCGKKTPMEEVPAKWEEKKAAIDVALDKPVLALPTPSTITCLQAAQAFYKYLTHRVETGQPEPLQPITAADYKRTVNNFLATTPTDGKHAGIPFLDRTVAGLGPEDFQTFAKAFAGGSPFTLSRVVAYIHAFFNFCKEEDLVDGVPQYGRYFVRPAQQQRRDRRMQQKKSYRPHELQALMMHASIEERAWFGLGLSGAMDNADIGYLTFGELDRANGVIDYRRRKVGKVLRLIPVHPVAWAWLDEYLTKRATPVAPEFTDRVFLTPTGLPLQRMRPGASGVDHAIDYVATCWGNLLQRAGLRPASKTISVCAICGKPRETKREGRLHRCVHCKVLGARRKRQVIWGGGSDQRGFRSLRTSFSNLAPPGFRDEVEMIMGHATGTVLLENYLEEVGTERLFELVNRIWQPVLTSPVGRGPVAAGSGGAVPAQAAAAVA